MKKTEQIGLLSFLPSILCETIYNGFSAAHVAFTAKEGLLSAVAAFAAAWLILLALRALGARVQQHVGFAKAWKGLLILGLLYAAGKTFCRIAMLYQRQYETGFLWILLLAGVLLVLTPESGAIERTAYAIIGLFLLAAIFLLLGLVGQISWRNLCFAAPRLGAVSSAFWSILCLCPEYLALPMYGKSQRRWWLLPAGAAAVQAGAFLLAESIFGFAEMTGCYPVMEAVRAWSFGSFSRLDALIAGIWLILALYRILLVGWLLRKTAKALAWKKERKAGKPV